MKKISTSSRKPRFGAKKSSPAPVKPAKSLGLELSDNPRVTAFRVLLEVASDQRCFDSPTQGRKKIMPRSAPGAKSGSTPEDSLALWGLLLSPRDMSLASALVYEVIRHQSYLDWLLKSRLTAGKASLELTVILRLGLAQLLYFDRLGDHAIVSETVALTKIILPGRHGLVNAVLRGLLRAREAGQPWPPQPLPSGDSVRDLAIKHSYPLWFVRRFVGALGLDEAEALLVAGNQATPATLRCNPLKGAREDLRAKLPFETTNTTMSPWGLRPTQFAGRPETWPGYEEGLFSVQDESSQLAGLLAGELAPDLIKILDACSGLGSKGLHLASLNPMATVISVDKDEAKLERLRAEAARLGVANIKTEARDLLADAFPPESFDLALVDAPCSGLGVIRRRPDLKWNKSEDDIARLAQLQQKLLGAVAASVKIGGRLLFGLCSFTSEEGPANATAFVAQHPDFKLVEPAGWPEILRPHLSAGGYLTLWPHKQDTDGFFWGMFEKTSTSAQGQTA